ncbi:protein transporter SEC61 subunit gamma, partial [Capronia epimyces CBS 606.96]
TTQLHKSITTVPEAGLHGLHGLMSRLLKTADRREFIKISQAVGMGFLIMGAIGYFIKLIHIPVNNVLVG